MPSGKKTLGKSVMLGQEIEMLMSERQALLQSVGAAAALVAELDTARLPAGAMAAANLLSSLINGLPEDLLQDALASVQASIDGA